MTIPARQVAGTMLAACWLLLAGCVSRGPLLDPASQSVELASTPFFSQLAHQCGPAALATLLGASGVEITPDELTPLVYLPGREGSLQIEMQAAPRRFDRLSYPLPPDLAAITRELDAGRPVLVLHNYGLPFWPRWHYAVVIGYDAATQKVLLRSGETRRQELSAKNFMRAWDNAGRWAVVLLRAGELPTQPEATTYLEAAAGFERVATAGSALRAFDAAVAAWPAEPVAWVGRGTAHYRAGDKAAAAADYRHALALDAALAGARNNLAMVLLEQGCPASARTQLELVDMSALSGSLVEAITDTRKQLEALGNAADTPTCVAAR